VRIDSICTGCSVAAAAILVLGGSAMASPGRPIPAPAGLPHPVSRRLPVPAWSPPSPIALPQLPVPASDPAVREALDYLRASEPETIADQVALCEVPAPPFGEQARGEAYRERFAALGLAGVRVDDEGNVLGEIGSGAPLVVLSAHLDTVFPAGTEVSVQRDGPMLTGPGIGDDCRGLAVVLAVARSLRRSGVEPAGTIAFVGTVGEEGPGDLRGVKRLFGETLAGRIDYFISVDGAGYGVTRSAVGSNRYEVTFHGPGGHSYGAFGMPNPIHALGRAIAKLADIEVPADPKTTFSVGLVEGGTSVNSIAYETTMTVDLRSESPEALADLDRRFRAAVRQALDEERGRWSSDVPLEVRIESIGVRPAGEQPLAAPIVQAALASAEQLGFEAATNASSTDANIPMSLGIPAVTIDGGGDGSGAHSLDETFDTTGSHVGTQWALLLVLTLVGLE
jgi:acetylornithine deacetylase/succinyl-diaminopimelate desuccinylase-like protein